jgi:hypothetical protein
MKSLSTVSFFLLLLIITNQSILGQYTLEKEIKDDEKIGTKAFVSTIESMYAKGNNLYFMSDNNTVTITDNNGLLIKKVTPIRNISLGYTGAIGRVAFDLEGNFYQYENSSEIRKYSSTRELLNSYNIREYINSDISLYNIAIEADSKGNVYFGGYNYSVVILDKDGKFIRSIGKRADTDGNFNGNIRKIMIDNSGNIYVRSGDYDYDSKIQVFNKDGVFLRKIVTKKTIDDFSFDEKGNIYLVNKSEPNFYVYDNTAKLISTTVLGTSEIIPFLVMNTSDNNFLIETANTSTQKRELMRLNSDYKKISSDLVITPLNSDFPVGVRDWQYHPVSKNLVVMDNYKLITYDKTLSPIKTITDSDKGIVSRYRPALFNFDENGKSYFIRDSGNGNFEYNVYSEDKPTTVLCKVKADWFIKKMFIEKDSLNNTTIVVVTPLSVKAYTTSGTVQKTLLSSTSYGISQVVKNTNNSFSVLNSSNDELETYDKNFKLLKKVAINILSPDDFAITSDGNMHDVQEYFNSLRINSYDKNGKLIVKSNTFDVNYGSDITIKELNDKIAVAQLYNNKISLINYNFKNTLKTNFISGPDVIVASTSEKTKTISSDYSASIKNLTYKIIKGESAKVSATGVLEIVKGGESVMEIISAENSEYNAASTKVLVKVNKVDPTISGSKSIQKGLNEADFKLDIKSESDTKLTITLVSGESISMDATNNIKILKEGISTIKIVSAENEKFNGYVLYAYVTVTKPTKITSVINVQAINKKLDDVDFTINPTSNSTSKFDFSLIQGDAISVSTDGKVKILKAGVATVRITQVENTTHLASTAQVNITVNKLEQTITIDNSFPISLYTNSSSFTPLATSNSGLAVESKIISGPAKLENGKVVLDGKVGVIEFEFNQKGNDRFNAAAALRKSVEVKVVLSTLEELREIGVNVYPNPTVDKVYISNNGKPCSIKLFDLMGRLIVNKDTDDQVSEIDMKNLPSGAYYILLNQEDKQLSIRVIKL